MESKKDFECAIWIGIVVYPVQTKCKHVFWRSWIHSYLENAVKKAWPMCRTKLDIKKFRPNVMTDLWKQVQSSFGDEIKDRLEAENKAIKMRENVLKLKIKYGNYHEEIKEFQTTHNGYENKHLWKIYVELEDDLRQTIFIKRVTFYLHESFVITDIVKKLPPYEYQCRGWGVFELPIHIEWQKWLNKETTIINHYLCFEGKGSHNSFILTIDKSEFLKHYPDTKENIAIKSLLTKQKMRALF